MSVPGAENPEKVKNIVRGQGILNGFRGLYEGAMTSVPGLRWRDQPHDRVGDWTWRGQGEEMLVVCLPSVLIILVRSERISNRTTRSISQLFSHLYLSPFDGMSPVTSLPPSLALLSIGAGGMGDTVM